MKKLFLLLFVCLAALHSSELSQIYFSPKDHIADRLIALIEQERTSLQIAVYCFTHREIAQALVDAKMRGVAVEVIIDPYSIKANIPVDKMLEVGIPVYVWALPSKSMRKPIMHHKFCVFGDGLLWTGSFNFTYQANKANQENVIVIDTPEVIQRYKDQFEALKRGPCMRYTEYLNAFPKNDMPLKKTG